MIPNLKFSEMGGRGYSGVNFGHPKSEVFRNGGGGGILVFNSRKGYSGKFGPKFTVQPETCLCITVVSHILRMWRLIICVNLTTVLLGTFYHCVSAYTENEGTNVFGKTSCMASFTTEKCNALVQPDRILRAS